MGDILHALPAVTALRRAHPTWKIDWAVEPRWLPLLSAELENAELGAARTAARPLVDQIHLVPAKAWSRNPLGSETITGIRELRAELRAAEYDAVLDLQGAVRSAVVARLTGCKRILGEAQPREMLAKWLFSERVKTTGKHVIDQDIEVAAAIAGDPLRVLPPALPRDLDAEEWCDQLGDLKEATWRGKPVALLHPGGGWGAKRWPADRYGAVAEDFASRGGVVLINSAPGEEELAKAVLAKSGDGGPISIVDCSLEQLIALTQRVSLVVGGDTGPLHLACALGKPVVGIYGPTDPKRNGPYGSRFRVLRNPESRQDHSRGEEPEAGLLTISPEMVMAAIVDLMLEERQYTQSRSYGQSHASASGQGWETASGPVWEAKRS